MSVASEYLAARSYGSNNGDAAGYVLARAFHYWRAYGYPASDALAAARRDVEKGTARYPVTGGAINPRNDKGEAWVERLADVGLRFVGWSDEIAGRAVSHRGWFLNDEGDGDVARGCVLQLPGRKGAARFVAAYRMGSDGKHGWSDMSGVEGSALVAFGEIFEGKCGDSYVSDYPEAREAALRADRMAELVAESERDYQADYRKGSDAAEAVADADAERLAARTLLAEVRGTLATDKPNVCAAIRATISGHLDSARTKYAEALAAFDEYGHSEPFREGAGAATYWALRK